MLEPEIVCFSIGFVKLIAKETRTAPVYHRIVARSKPAMCQQTAVVLYG